MRIVYHCGLCDEPFDTADDAVACEARGAGRAIVKVGDIVFASAGYGWFDGDARWVSNPDVRANAPGARTKGSHPDGRNCFDACCTFKFFYVVTAIERAGHRKRYHLRTLAMTGREGHEGGFTYSEDHVAPTLATDVPQCVIDASKELIGWKSRGLI